MGTRSDAASKGVVVTVLGLAEFVEEEDHGLKAQDQHDSTDEAGGIKRVLVRLRGGGDCCGARVGSSCGKRHNGDKAMAALHRNLVTRPALRTCCRG